MQTDAGHATRDADEEEECLLSEEEIEEEADRAAETRRLEDLAEARVSERRCPLDFWRDR